MEVCPRSCRRLRSFCLLRSSISALLDSARVKHSIWTGRRSFRSFSTYLRSSCSLFSTCGCVLRSVLPLELDWHAFRGSDASASLHFVFLSLRFDCRPFDASGSPPSPPERRRSRRRESAARSAPSSSIHLSNARELVCGGRPPPPSSPETVNIRLNSRKGRRPGLVSGWRRETRPGSNPNAAPDTFPARGSRSREDIDPSVEIFLGLGKGGCAAMGGLPSFPLKRSHSPPRSSSTWHPSLRARLRGASRARARRGRPGEVLERIQEGCWWEGRRAIGEADGGKEDERDPGEKMGLRYVRIASFARACVRKKM